MGRRVEKKATQISTNTLESSERFIYDNWNLIATYQFQTSVFTLQTAYTWGLDLSQTLHGAGGVGGLLKQADRSTPPAVIDSCYTYDANGNVSELLNTSGSIVAHYEYSPFGGGIYSSGASAAANPFRFSTKYLDTETGFYYYGYRHYDPTTGRWLSKDPIEEQGGLNLYAMVSNAPVNFFDFLGLVVCINSYGEPQVDENGHTFRDQDEVSEQELENWERVEDQLSQSEAGREILERINDPDYTLNVDSAPGAEPGGTYSDENNGHISVDLHDPSGISPDTREQMFQDGLEDGRVQDRSDFNNQVSGNIGVVAGHEMGHAVLNQRDEPRGNNVGNTENSIRSGVGEQPRLNYGPHPVPQN